MSEETAHARGPDPLTGLTNCRYLSLERAAIRTRESSMTRSGWKLWVSCEEGEGSISLIEISPTVSLYRGDGVFLGWESDRLEAAYRRLLPPSNAPEPEPGLQLG